MSEPFTRIPTTERLRQLASDVADGLADNKPTAPLSPAELNTIQRILHERWQLLDRLRPNLTGTDYDTTLAEQTELEQIREKLGAVR